MISPAFARSLMAVAWTCMAGLLAVILLGHYIVTPIATALLGVTIGCQIGARRCLRRHQEITGGRW